MQYLQDEKTKMSKVDFYKLDSEGELQLQLELQRNEKIDKAVV